MALKAEKGKIVISTVGKQIKSQRGFTYILVMVALVVIAILAEMASVPYQYRIKRDKEAELLFRGQAYMRAIESYYHAKKELKIYPKNLEDLLNDPRFAHKWHIRQLYTDPLTGEDWQLIRAPDGGIAGVVSSSRDIPLKQSNFPKQLKQFTGAEQYSDWTFEYKAQETPPASEQNANPE